MDIKDYLAEAKRAVDDCLETLLPAESCVPTTIHKAMRYSIFAGGKRIRPILVLASGERFGGNRETLLRLGAAVEMIHTYSLIHDDLPALDNDDLRRGRPTCHKVFGEAMAVLAGDALLTRAFQVIAEVPSLSDLIRLKILHRVAYAVGTVDAMIGGQVVDLESEGKEINPPTLDYIHRSKTGALLAACTHCGALAGGANGSFLDALTQFGQKIGLAFQIVDDILDVTSSSKELGKTVGKDEQVRKATYPALYGVAESRLKAERLVMSAIDQVQRIGEGAKPLQALAKFVLDRAT